MGDLKRNYLNTAEENFYMVMMVVLQMMQGLRNLEGTITKEVWEEWNSRGMLTPAMKKNLKLAYTYLNKFCIETNENLDKKQQDKLSKRLVKYDLKIIDDYKLQKLMRDIGERSKYVVMNRNLFIDIMADMSAITCVGCKKDYKGCSICKSFEDVSIPYLGEEPNCPYAVDLAEFTPEQKVKYEEVKARLKSKNKFIK